MQEPFKGYFKSFKEVVEGVGNDRKRPEIPQQTPLPLADLLRRCFSHDAAERPTFEEIVNSAVFDNVILEQAIDPANQLGRKFWKRSFTGKTVVRFQDLLVKLLTFLEINFPPDDFRIVLFKDLVGAYLLLKLS